MIRWALKNAAASDEIDFRSVCVMAAGKILCVAQHRCSHQQSLKHTKSTIFVCETSEYNLRTRFY